MHLRHDEKDSVITLMVPDSSKLWQWHCRSAIVAMMGGPHQAGLLLCVPEASL
jgi:hypothetical protein